MSARGGADAPQGPGWWLASDGRYYPPHLTPGTGRSAGASEGAASSPGPSAADAPPKKKKKKVVKKVVAKPSAAAARAKAKGPAAKPATAPDPTVDFTEKRPGHLKYTAKPPSSDQVAARRIQAKEQMVLLADARQTAALRLLANLGEPEPVLVGVGGRDLEARSAPGGNGHTAEARSAPAPAGAAPMSPPAIEEAEADAPTVVDEPEVVEPPSTSAPATPTAEVITDSPPPATPEVGEAAAAPEDSAEVVARPAPHEPEQRPAPRQAAMGTDVPFMEVKGSPLATDIDRIGERILIYADRVELRDRSHAVRQSIRYDQLAAVEVQKKMMGPTLLITSVAGATMTAKALRPELATGAKAMIDKHAARFRGEPLTPAGAAPEAPTEEVRAAAPPPPEPSGAVSPDAGSKTHRSVLLAMLDELHAAGILSPEEMDQKRALIERTDRA